MDRNTLKETLVRHKTGKLAMIFYENEKYVPYHWHDEYEILSIKKGVCTVIVEGNTHILHEGDIIIVKSGELHTLSSNPDLDFFALVFHPFLMYGEESEKYFSKRIKLNRTINDACLTNILDEMLSIYKEKPFAFEVLLKARLLNFFSYVFENNLYEITEEKKVDSFGFFADLLNYVHENYKEKLSLLDLSEFAHISPAYIITLFKKNTGKTPFDYINSYRIHKSAEQLKNTEKNVLDIALDTGFENYSYFIRTFKKYMNTTPLQYRMGKGIF